MNVEEKTVCGIAALKIADDETGAWRLEKPVPVSEKCVQCKTCESFCPLGVITVLKDGIEIDMYYCKGCGLCSEVCPKQAIEMEIEGE